MNLPIIRKLSLFLKYLTITASLCCVTLSSMAAVFSGVIQDQTGVAIEGAKAMIFKVVGGSLTQQGEILQVGSNGQYSWEVDDGQ